MGKSQNELRLYGAVLMAVLACLALATLPTNGADAKEKPVEKPVAQAWVGTWASSQYIPDATQVEPPADMTDATLRQIVRLTIGGTRFRVRLSNVFGTAPLKIVNAHVARAEAPGSPRIDVATDKVLTFGGATEIVIPAGGEYVSDPVAITLPDLSNLAITFYMADPPAQETSHAGARTHSYLVHGDHAADADLTDPKSFVHWFELSAVDVETTAGAAAIVALGDSITDGYGTIPNTNTRWTDRFAERLQTLVAPHARSVLNQGIGGNRLLLDGAGPNAMARFDRDVILQTGVRYLLVLEGINDLGTLTRTAPVSEAEHAALVKKIITAFGQMINRAHAYGITTIGGTIMPFGGSEYYHPDALNEADRQTINVWIRTPGHFDAIVDFDKIMGDPAHPDRLRADLDSGDHLHPSPAGYRVMGEAVPLDLFTVK